MRVIGTWKNRLDYEESIQLADQLAAWLEARPLELELSICPPMIALAGVRESLPETVRMGSQNLIWDADNSFTGETSARSLKALGCDLAMIGHSERRVHLGETDEQVALKVATALDHALVPLVCLGESYDERKAGETTAVLERQIQPLLPRLRELDDPEAVLIAYEPAWAITTNKEKLPANPQLAEDDHLWLRNFLAENLPEIGRTIPLVYGAGVNATNVAEFLAVENIDGVLVGGASQSIASLTELLALADTVTA